jgi:phage shock protein A
MKRTIYSPPRQEDVKRHRSEHLSRTEFDRLKTECDRLKTESDRTKTELEEIKTELNGIKTTWDRIKAESGLVNGESHVGSVSDSQESIDLLAPLHDGSDDDETQVI